MTDIRQTMSRAELAPMAIEAASALAQLVLATLQDMVTSNAVEEKVATSMQAAVTQRLVDVDVNVERPGPQVIDNFIDLFEAVNDLAADDIDVGAAQTLCETVNDALTEHLQLDLSEIKDTLADMRYPSPDDEQGMRVYAAVAGATEVLRGALEQIQPEKQREAFLPPDPDDVIATAQTAQSLITSINAGIGENEAYKQAIFVRGEFSLIPPSGPNAPGPDFATVVQTDDDVRIAVYDAKTSGVPRFPSPKDDFPESWNAMIDKAIENYADPDIKARLQQAWEAGQVDFLQVNVNRSPQKPDDGPVRSPQVV